MQDFLSSGSKLLDLCTDLEMEEPDTGGEDIVIYANQVWEGGVKHHARPLLPQR